MAGAAIWSGRAGQVWPAVLAGVRDQLRGGRRILLLVPEQNTLQCERDLVRGLELPGLMDIEVLSPRRLQLRIREAGGHGPLTPLDDRGRAMVIAQALSECRENLVYYRRAADRPSLPERISRLLLDLQRVDLTPELLREHAANCRGAEALKYQDIALLWERCEAWLAGRFADEGAQQRELLERVGPSGIARDAEIWVLGFDLLPLPTCRLLAEAAAEAHSLTAVFIMDRPETEEDGEPGGDARIFAGQYRAAADLRACLRERGLPCAWVRLPAGERPDTDPALRHLERNLFAYSPEKYPGPTEAVRLMGAADPYAEALCAAAALRRWHEAGIPWEEMAVAVGDGSALPGILADLLPSAGIPAYVARKDSALRHGLSRLLLGSLRAAAQGYAAADVLLAAKSGFSPLEEREAALLENYAVTNGITRGKWRKPFTRGDEATVAEAEALRQKLIAPIERLREGLAKARNADASLTAIYAMLEECGAYGRLQAREEALLARGMEAEAARNRQIWRILMELMDQLHALLGERRVTLKDAARLVASGLQAVTISALPPRPGQVSVTAADQLGGRRPRALLLMGMQDGVLGVQDGELITEEERERLTERFGRQVGIPRRQRSAMRQSAYYQAVAAPTERLMITFSEAGMDGGALREAILVHEVRRLFPALEVEGGVTARGGELPLSPELAMEGLAVRLRRLADGTEERLPEVWEEALRALWRDPAWHGRAEGLIGSLRNRAGQTALPPALVARLSGQDRTSISRLESWAECPYRYLVDYLLRPVQRRDFTYAADERGTFYHEAMDRFAREAALLPGWPEVTREEVDALLDRLLPPLTGDWENGPLREDPIGELAGAEYVRAVRRAAWQYVCQMKESDFRTLATEVAFGEADGGLPGVTLRLPDGRNIVLRGRIDRVDGWRAPDGTPYLRVVDNKSGQKKLEPARIDAGAQLQLLLYLRASLGMARGAEPAGAYYYRVTEPKVDVGEETPEAVDSKMAGELKMRGVTLADPAVVEALDRHNSYSIQKIFAKNGEVDSRAFACDKAQMEDLLELARRRAVSTAQSIREGKFPVRPITAGASADAPEACSWCAHKAMCGYEGRGTRLPKMKPAELIEKAVEEAAAAR